MPIEFESFKSENYFTSKWAGKVLGADSIVLYQHFLESSDWLPGMNELADLSQFDFKSFTAHDIFLLAKFSESFYKKHGFENIKTAVFCASDLQYGMSNAYSAWADESPELVHLFKDINKAKEWLVKKN